MNLRHQVPWCGLLGVALLCVSLPGNTQSPGNGKKDGAPPVFGRQVAAGQGAKYVPGQLLVRFRSGVQKSSREAAHRAAGSELLRAYRLVDNLELVRLPQGVSPEQAARAYRQNPAVLYAQPNYIYHADQSPVTPNDPRFPELWGLHNTGQTSGVADADIDAPEAWALSTGSSNVVVGIIDTGIDYNHQDLSANVFSTADCNSDGVDDDGNGFVDDCHGIDSVNGDSDPMDDAGHGTHVAGTIGGVGNNGIGVVGVNWQVRILACKFLDFTGSGSDDGAIACLDYFATMKDRGVNLVATNNSWGGGSFSQALLDAIDAHRQRGILFLAAAGNSSSDNDTGAHFPSSFYLPNVISVAATNRTDARASFSSSGRHTVHLGAPGEDVLSTLPGNTYDFFSGTSMATPHVTGVAALLKAQDPARDWKAIKNLLLAGGNTIPALANTITGKRLNAHGSMTCSNSALLSRLQPVPTTTTAAAGFPLDLAVLNINCAVPNGTVQVLLDSGAQTFTLLDDGLGADQEAGDGIYTARWIPSGTGSHTLTFPGGDVVTVQLLAPYQPPTSVAFNYRTITGTSLGLGDDTSAQITSPFPVQFGGGSFTTLNVNSNGNISFTNSFTSAGNDSIPTPATYTLVAAFWDDLFPYSGNVFWAVTGTAPSRELVVEWRDMGHFNCLPGPAVKFQVVFFEGSGDVLFNYADTLFDATGQCFEAVDAGASASVGVQVAPNAGQQFSFDTPSLADNTSLLWKVGPLTPAVTQLSPFTAIAGDPAFTLKVSGKNFVGDAMVRWNGSDRPTNFVSTNELRASISAADISAPGPQSVTVFDPGPIGAGESAPLDFTVYSSYPAPSLTSAVPSTMLAGSRPFDLTATGAQFVSKSVLRWNGSDRPTKVSNSTTLTASIRSNDIATAGTAQITVFSPAPGGGESSPQTIAIDNPVPEAFFVTPRNVPAGGPAFTLHIFGFHFLPASVVRWNGSDRPTTLASVFELTAAIAAADVATPGTAQITVFNPAPGGGASLPLPVPVVTPPANDQFSSAMVVPSSPFTQTVDTRGASADSADPLPPCASLTDNSVWYSFAIPAGAVVLVDTFGSSYDTILSAWTGSPGSFVSAGCNDDADFFTNFQSQLSITRSTATTVHFMVSSYPFDAGGTLVFHLAVQASFQLQLGSSSATVARGQTANYTITVNPQFGTLTNPLVFTCPNLPLGLSCSFTPNNFMPGANPTTVTLSVSTSGLASNTQRERSLPVFAFWLALPGLGLLGTALRNPSPQKRRLVILLLLLFVMVLAGSQANCGGGGGGGQPPPPQQFNITVRGASGTATQQTVLSLTVTR